MVCKRAILHLEGFAHWIPGWPAAKFKNPDQMLEAVLADVEKNLGAALAKHGEGCEQVPWRALMSKTSSDTFSIQ